MGGSAATKEDMVAARAEEARPAPAMEAAERTAEATSAGARVAGAKADE